MLNYLWGKPWGKTQLVDRRCLSLLYVRVQVAQFDSCVVGGEVPVDLALAGVGLLLPGGELGVEHSEVLDAAVQALAGERGQPGLGDVEPGPVPGVWWISRRCASPNAVCGSKAS